MKTTSVMLGLNVNPMCFTLFGLTALMLGLKVILLVDLIVLPVLLGNLIICTALCQ